MREQARLSSGQVLILRARQRWAWAAGGAALLVALGCLAYVALYQGDVVGMVMETLRVGPG